MSRCYNTSGDTGLSRQSTKTYKVIRQKSNAELSEKLRRLDIEHNTNIAKILNERYNLRTIHYNLTHSGGETSSDSDSDGTEELHSCHGVSEAADIEEVHSAEKKAQAPSVDSSKKQNFLQLPSIVEDSPVVSKQHSRSPKLGRSPLPPLSEHGFPTRLRKSSEGVYGNPTMIRPRQRSSTFPAPQLLGERQRKSELKRISKHEKSTHSDGERVGDDKPNQSRSQSDDGKSTKSTKSWESELHGCRYLRHTRFSSPDFLDTEAIFERTPDK